jgi:hypothetical protein
VGVVAASGFQFIFTLKNRSTFLCIECNIVFVVFTWQQEDVSRQAVVRFITQKIFLLCCALSVILCLLFLHGSKKTYRGKLLFGLSLKKYFYFVVR